MKSKSKYKSNSIDEACWWVVSQRMKYKFNFSDTSDVKTSQHNNYLVSSGMKGCVVGGSDVSKQWGVPTAAPASDVTREG